MKHAYLILAHNEYEVLSKLIELIDDPRNDIFIHIDKKSELPDESYINTLKSEVYFLKDRVDVRWGHVSQIEAEINLFQSAHEKRKYDFLHLISGVHLPLFDQNHIHDFYSTKIGTEIFSPMESDPVEAENKMHRYNFFMDEFRANGKDNLTAQRLWRLLLELQHKFGIRRNKGLSFEKASNWVSISSSAAKYLVDRKSIILNRYKYTMCGDEFFVISELINSNMNWKLEHNNKILKHEIINANAKTYKNEDFEELIKSECLFARKFSSNNSEIIKLIENKIKNF